MPRAGDVVENGEGLVSRGRMKEKKKAARAGRRCS